MNTANNPKEIIINPQEKYTEEEWKKVNEIYPKMERDIYRDFRQNLIHFWKKSELAKEKQVQKIKVRFFGEGLTGAFVFRCEVHLNDAGEELVRVLKYDTIENIEKERKNYKDTIRKNESIFPTLGEFNEFAGDMAILPMSSIIDSEIAEDFYSVIEFLWQKYQNENRHLFYNAEKIARALKEVYEVLFKTFYRVESHLHYAEEPNLYEYFYYKVNTKKLNEKNGVIENTHRKFFENSCKIIKEDATIYDTFLNLELNYKPLITGHAIHGDFNPNNILLAVKKQQEIKPMVIDFLEIKFAKKDKWCPLLHDFARLETQILLYYFHYLYKEETDLSEESLSTLITAFGELLHILNLGIFLPLSSPNPNILNKTALDYIFRIVYNLRKTVMELCPKDTSTEEKLEYYANYLYSAMSFSFFFLKFKDEKGIDVKRHFATKAAFQHRKSLMHLTELKPEKLFQMRKLDKLGIEESVRAFLEEVKLTYIPPVEKVNEILEFILNSKNQFLLVEGVPGIGKTSLSKYMSLLLNHEIESVNLKQDYYCLTYFFGSDKNICSETEIYSKFQNKLRTAFSINWQEEYDKNSDERWKFSKTLELIYHEHLRESSQLILWFDAINQYQGTELLNVIPSVCPPNVKIVITTRPNNEKLNQYLKGKFSKIELESFSYTDLKLYFEKRERILKEESYKVLFHKTNGLQIFVRVLLEILEEKEGKTIELKEKSPKKESRNEELNKLYVNYQDYSGLYEFYFRINEQFRKKCSGTARRILLSLSLTMAPISIRQLYQIHKEYLISKSFEFEEDGIDEITAELKTISEVILQNGDGRIELFHPSFKGFLLEKYKEDIIKIKDGFFQYLQHYKEFEKGSEDFQYYIEHLGIHLYEWSEEKNGVKFQKFLESIIIDILNMPKEEFEAWFDLLKNTTRYIVFHRDYQQEAIFRSILKTSANQLKEDQVNFHYIRFIGVILSIAVITKEKKKTFEYLQEPLKIIKEFISLKLNRISLIEEFFSLLDGLTVINSYIGTGIRISNQYYKEYKKIIIELASSTSNDFNFKMLLSDMLDKIISHLYSNDISNNSFETDLKRSLLTSYNNIGIYYKSIGDTQKALKHFKESLKIRKELISLEPDRTDFKRDYASSLFFISTFYIQIEETEKSLKLIQEALLIAEALVKKDPENFESAVLLFGFCWQLFSITKEKDFLKKALTVLEPFYTTGRLPEGIREMYEKLKGITGFS